MAPTPRVLGNYVSATGTFTLERTSGTDTLVVYDGDSTSAVTQTGIVLENISLKQLQSFNGSNQITGMIII